MDTTSALPPNHHADHPGFSGVGGALCAVGFAVRAGARVGLAVDAADVGPGDVLVDIGCGPGALARLAAGRGASAVGVDPAPVMLRVARLMTRSPAVTYALGGAESLPVDDASATVVTSVATVHHWTDIDRGLAEVVRALRPGGRLVAIERRVEEGADGLASHGWVPAQADAFAEACGRAGLIHAAVAVDSADGAPHLVVTATRP